MVNSGHPVHTVCLETSFGPLYVSGNGTAVCEIGRGPRDETAVPDYLRKARAQLEEYLGGTRRSLDFPVDPQGTDFQKAVWKGLQAIPYGKTVTYGQLARALGKPGAARAVGAAAGKNPCLLAIPCHRLVAAGGLGRFSAGLPLKRFLLALEGIRV